MPLQQSQHRRGIVVGAASITLPWEKKIKRVRGVEPVNKITFEQYVRMAKDAIEAWIITALRFGDEIPAIDGCYLQYAIDEIEDVETTPRETEGSYSETAGSRV
jgi:hypothetical protein